MEKVNLAYYIKSGYPFVVLVSDGDSGRHIIAKVASTKHTAMKRAQAISEQAEVLSAVGAARKYPEEFEVDYHS